MVNVSGSSRYIPNASHECIRIEKRWRESSATEGNAAMMSTRMCPCTYKDTFESMGAARKVVKQMRGRTKRGKSHSLAQVPYKCNCGGFHLAYPARSRAYENARHR